MSAAVRSSEDVHMIEGISARMPPKLKEQQLLLPLVSYTCLAGAVAATVMILQPYAGYGIGVALTGFSVGMPIVMMLGPLAMMGSSGIAKTLGGAETSDAYLKRLATDAATAVGVPAPRVFEVNSLEPNAFAASGLRGQHDTTVAVTTGLREILSTEELKAVLAHEMGHLRHRDVMRNIHIAAATAGLGGIYQLGNWLMEAELRSERKRKRSGKKKDKDEGSVAPLALGLMAGGLVLEGSAHLLRRAATQSSRRTAPPPKPMARNRSSMRSRRLTRPPHGDRLTYGRGRGRPSRSP